MLRFVFHRRHALRFAAAMLRRRRVSRRDDDSVHIIMRHVCHNTDAYRDK